MQGRLQQTYKVARELVNNAYFQGEMSLSQMSRLAELILADQQDPRIEVTFEFGYNVYGFASLKGHYKVQLDVECQRCLAPMVYPIDQDFELLIDASDDDIEALQIDSVYTQDGYLDIFEVIEDELILALPIVMMHEDRYCNEYLQREPTAEPVAKENNPFAVLEALKGRK